MRSAKIQTIRVVVQACFVLWSDYIDIKYSVPEDEIEVRACSVAYMFAGVLFSERVLFFGS